MSIWARDRAKGERVARTLQAELTWVNEHGAVAPGPALRLQRHVAARQVASRPALIGGARRLPYDPRSFGPEPPPRGWSTGAKPTACACSARRRAARRAALRIGVCCCAAERRGTAAGSGARGSAR